jgi:hypothetical protein
MVSDPWMQLLIEYVLCWDEMWYLFLNRDREHWVSKVRRFASNRALTALKTYLAYWRRTTQDPPKMVI